MQNGGHIEGYFLDKEKQVNVSEALNKLVENKEDKLMFAVGDGNHSLATAKECYNLSKSPLARYALVEIVNIHDDSIEFEPIYRVLFNVDAKGAREVDGEAPGGMQYVPIKNGKIADALNGVNL